MRKAKPKEMLCMCNMKAGEKIKTNGVAERQKQTHGKHTRSCSSIGKRYVKELAGLVGHNHHSVHFPMTLGVRLPVLEVEGLDSELD